MRQRSASFIGQSTRSNYCGVYSSGMLLSMLGFPMNRLKALALFNLRQSNPTYEGASHEEIARAFTDVVAPKYCAWREDSLFEFHGVLKRLRSLARPTLLSFGIVHKNNLWRCQHVAVVVRTNSRAIELLDPLGPRPLLRAMSNVQLVYTNENLSRTQVLGGSYRVNHKKSAVILYWS